MQELVKSYRNKKQMNLILFPQFAVYPACYIISNSVAKKSNYYKTQPVYKTQRIRDRQ